MSDFQPLEVVDCWSETQPQMVENLNKISIRVNPYPAKLIYLNFQILEVVSRYSDPQLQVAENYSILSNLGTHICKF